MKRLFATTPSTKPMRSPSLQKAWYQPTNSHPEAMPVKRPANTWSAPSSPVLPAENGMARVPTLAQRATARTLHGRSSQASLALGDASAGTSDTTQATSDIS